MGAGAEERAALAERVGVCTPDKLVEFIPVGRALIVPTEETCTDDEGVGVGVAATTGYNAGNKLFTSEGRAWYHAGVFPAERDEAICAANADDEASA